MRKKNQYPILSKGLMWATFLCFQVHLVGQVSNLPIFSITTEKEIKNEPKVPGVMHIFHKTNGDSNSLTDPPNSVFDIGIEFRGQSSQSLFPKKGFGIDLRSSSGQDTSAALFGWPSSHRWVIHSPYSDKSLIRNVIGYGLARSIMEYAPRTQIIELYINEEYYGVVVLVEAIEAIPGKVPIEKPSSGEVDGGYILKFDKGGEREKVWTSAFSNDALNQTYSSLLAHDPKRDNLSDRQLDFIRQWLDNLDNLLSSENFGQRPNGFSDFIDIESLMDYMLLSELSRNVDAYRNSTYLYKKPQNAGGKLHFGPVWDYNIAYGNADFCNGFDFEGWAWNFNSVCPEQKQKIHFWWKRFLEDEDFVEELEDRWELLRDGPLSDDEVRSMFMRHRLHLRGPQERNFERWPVLGAWIWPNYFVGRSFAEELFYLEDWLISRLSWMDKAIDDENFGINEEVTIYDYTVSPNPSSTSFLFHLKSRSIASEVTFRVLDLNGIEVHQSEKIPFVDQAVDYRWSPTSSTRGTYLVQVWVNDDLYDTQALVYLP